MRRAPVLPSKWWTFDCEECPAQLEHLCFYGTNVKRLSPEQPGHPHQTKHCEYRYEVDCDPERYRTIAAARERVVGMFASHEERPPPQERQGKLF